MNRKLFEPLRRAGEHLLYIQGAKDCATGSKPRRKNKWYMRGFSDQYESEAAIEKYTFLEEFYEI